MGAKLKVVAQSKADERVYALARETKGCWVFMWENAPEETPEWARKWYVLKSDYPVCPGKSLKVTIAPM